jgi:hypothetical protein
LISQSRGLGDVYKRQLINFPFREKTFHIKTTFIIISQCILSPMLESTITGE